MTLLSRPFRSESLYWAAEMKNFVLWSSTRHPRGEEIDQKYDLGSWLASNLIISEDYHYKLSQKRCNPYAARGVQATVNNETYYVSGPRLLEMPSLTPESNIKSFADTENKKQFVVYLTTKDKIIAATFIADVIRPESKQGIQSLKDMGIEVTMLTGDSNAVEKGSIPTRCSGRQLCHIIAETARKIAFRNFRYPRREPLVSDNQLDNR